MAYNRRRSDKYFTLKDKQAYLSKWHRFQQRYERIYTTKFKAALKTQVDEFIKHYKRVGPSQATMHISSEPIHKVLVSLHKTVGPLWAHKTEVHKMKPKRKSMTTPVSVKARMPMGFNERIVELMRQYYGIDLLNDAEQITAYTREVIQNVLNDAALSGASINDIVRSLESNNELSTMRARRIARTETVTAANGAAVINAKELGVPLRKIWLAVQDKRTRHDHRMVDDMVVGIDDAFNVGGSMMNQPGVRKQPNGLPVPAKEVVNCRCTLGFEVIE